MQLSAASLFNWGINFLALKFQVYNNLSLQLVAPINAKESSTLMLPRPVSNKKIKKLQIVNLATSSIIIPFLIFHFLCVAPVVNFLCLCPQNDPDWECNCNCSKCTQRRQSTSLSFHFSSAKNIQKGLAVSCKGDLCKLNNRPASKGILPTMPVESGSCNCRHQSKEVSKDIKQFIPIPFVAELTDNPVQVIEPAEIMLISEYFPHPFERPG